MANTGTNIKPHIVQVDYIRAIASMAVALFHLGGKALPVLKYGWLGVQMFFLLSGFIICWAIPENYQLRMFGKFAGKRILRIEPPYLISIALIIILQYIFSSGYQIDWGNVLTHLASSAQRVRWFKQGFEGGSIDRCNTFNAAQL